MIGLKQGTVRVVPYQPTWKRYFEQEAARLRAALGSQALQVEHIGSTAVEGLEAKPIIDVMVAVESLEEARDLVPLVETLGYEHQPEDPIPDRVFFAQGPPSRRTHHLSLTPQASAYWSDHLLFRDYLRTHPEAAAGYQQLKRDLADRYPADRESYTSGKDEFIQSILAKAKTQNPNSKSQAPAPNSKSPICG